ncbi:MAG: hypothetical protein AB1714_29825 [Acidobacteriota bacterium]
MKYKNARTGIEVDLSRLSSEERSFYKRARERFDRGVHWLSFDDFAFGMNSPIYKGKKSHLDVLKEPLYRVLKDMWLELGVRQGKVAAAKHAEQARERVAIA